MTYTVLVSSQAARDLRALDAATRRRIQGKIEGLATDPFPPGRKKLKGQTGDVWRIRVGDFRVLYDVEQASVTVLVLRVRNRKNVY